eukprot:3630310-Ditylum_brightwellii.AAC.1
MERSKQNKCVDGNKDDSVYDSVDSVNKHLTHLSPAVDCYLTERSDSNVCVDGGKEGVDNSVDNSDDNSDDSGDKYLTHFTQIENNVNLGGCDKHLTHVVKNISESLISDVTGHVTHVIFLERER